MNELFRWLCRLIGLMMGFYVFLAMLPVFCFFLICVGLRKMFMEFSEDAAGIMEQEILEYYHSVTKFIK